MNIHKKIRKKTLTLNNKFPNVNILTTGTNSGLGRYIYENLGGLSLTRTTLSDKVEEIKHKGAAIIIHCAFNSNQKINSASLYQYIQDNVFLTNELVQVPHKKFIFLSSVDVYPRDGALHSEDEMIDINSVNGIYGITKLISESIVKEKCKNYLILRPGSLLGKYSRKNSLIRIIEQKNCTLTLSGDSRFNFVLHSDILEFIKFSIKNDIRGIYNVTSTDNVTLLEAADLLNKKVRFGSYKYDVGSIDNNKILLISSVFKKTSTEVIKQFVQELKK